MKIAISGKGGSGKTTISGTLARVLAESGRDVVAIDDDDNPNLALTLGIDPKTDVPPVPEDLLEAVQVDGETAWQLSQDAGTVVADHGVEAPDDIRLLKMGEIDEAGAGCFCGAHATASHILAEIEGDVTIVDMVAGVEHLSRGTAADVDRLLVVVEPYFKSLRTGARTQKLADDLGIPDVRFVANKIRDDHDREAVHEFCDGRDLDVVAEVPFDDAIRRADQRGQAPIDAAPDSPAVQAIRELAGTIR